MHLNKRDCKVIGYWWYQCRLLTIVTFDFKKDKQGI